MLLSLGQVFVPGLVAAASEEQHLHCPHNDPPPPLMLQVAGINSAARCSAHCASLPLLAGSSVHGIVMLESLLRSPWICSVTVDCCRSCDL